MYKENEKNKNIFRYVKLTDQLLFITRFPNDMLT